ncbi:MAG: multiheme c-type cytochrome [Pirellulales bacterium]|nr:multiheme c-type cytochrome [Pirellulales bacterium]
MLRFSAQRIWPVVIGGLFIAALILILVRERPADRPDHLPWRPERVSSDQRPDNQRVLAGPAGAVRNADGTFGKDRIDPVKLNGPIFEGWDAPAPPRAVILLSGAQNGYIEPCGCAGLENQKGGMSRRHELIISLVQKKWPLVAIDAGGLVKEQSFGKQAVLKYTAAVASLKAMKYSVIGFGAPELRLPVDEVISVTAQDGAEPSPFVSANVALLTFADQLTDPARVVTVNGLKIGVTSVITKQEFQQLNNQNLEFKPPATALAEIVPTLVKANCQRLILLCHGEEKDAVELAQKFPQFTDIVITQGSDEPAAQPKTIPGTKTLLLETGHKGMFVVALGLYDNPQQPVRYQRVPLDARFGDSPAITQIFTTYQEQLRDLGLKGLGLEKSPPHPSGRAFIGSEACGDCHTKAYKIWKDSGHAGGTDTLVELTPPRIHDPECLSCHVTGWDPQRYFPYTSGYLGQKETPLLEANGCENCHGPGKKHAQAELGETQLTEQQIGELRNSMKVTLADMKKTGCAQCHDIDNSPAFNFETYWPEVEHYGKD